MDLRSVPALLRPAVVAAFASVAGGCVAEPAEGALERETFIETYVDLRVAALSDDRRPISDEARAEVLARHGVSEEALVAFVEAHASDLELMRDVWNEVELRMDALRPDSTERSRR